MTRVIEARAVISAADKTGGAFAAVAEKLRRLQGAAKSASSAVASASRISHTVERAQGIGRSGFLAAASGKALAAGGVGYGAAAALKRNAEVELAVTRIGVNADASDEKIAEMRTGLRDLAFQAGKSFNEVTEGLADLVAGGAELPDALKSLPAIVRTAQAAGAEVKDMSSTSLSLGQSLGISAEKMQSAFDIMVQAGKEGKFELKDMARYFPSLAPQAATLGLKGEAGLTRMVALLQTIRAGTGTAEEAASGFRDLMSKMETDETFNKFEKFGVNIRKELGKARKEGKDLFETFAAAAKKATKGDLSKLPQLMGDVQGRTALLALMTYGDLLEKVMAKARQAAGVTDRDLMRISQTQQIMINKFSESIDRAQSAIGAAIGKYASSDINAISSALETAVSDGLMAGVKDFFGKIHPGADGDLIGQLVTAMTTAMGLKPAAPMFTPERAAKARQEVEDRRGVTLKDRLLAEEAVERARKAGLGEMLEPLDHRMRNNPLIADARESLFSVKRHAPVPFNSQTGGQMGAFGRGTADTWFASQPKPPPGWSESLHGLLRGGETTVKAEVTGEAELRNKVDVDVKMNTELFNAHVRSIVGEEVRKIPLRSTNGPGSTGVSSPDARPGSVGIGSR